MLQEIKTENENFPITEFEKEGYTSYIFGQKSYNGVAFLSKIKINNISTNFVKDKLKPVSYTHLTLPTKRIV